MSAWRRSVTLAAVALAAVAASGCGSSKELPKDIPTTLADGLVANLNAVFTACETQDRAGAKSAARLYAQAVADLPPTISADNRTILAQTAENLTKLAEDRSQCSAGPTGPTGLSGPTTSTGTSTETTTTPPVTTTDTTTDTTTTDTTTTDTTPAPPTGGGGSGGGGGGKPSGGGGSDGNSGGVGAGKSKTAKHSKVER
jgi:hypothetical protein